MDLICVLQVELPQIFRNWCYQIFVDCSVEFTLSVGLRFALILLASNYLKLFIRNNPEPFSRIKIVFLFFLFFFLYVILHYILLEFFFFDFFFHVFHRLYERKIGKKSSCKIVVEGGGKEEKTRMRCRGKNGDNE